MLLINIAGNPIPWKRTGQRVIANSVINYDRQKLEKERTRWQIRAHYEEPPMTTPLAMEITFFMPIPKGTSKKKTTQMQTGFIRHMKRPDIDNLQKYILDTMTGHVYVDDAQIDSLNVRKQYSTNPRTVIEITPGTNNPVIESTVEEDDFY